MARFLKQSPEDCIAIAVETGIQNTGIAILLLRVALLPPSDDLTTGKFKIRFFHNYYFFLQNVNSSCASGSSNNDTIAFTAFIHMAKNQC